ncbi:hypothetical protein FS837_000112 [Tulasnella sp. UAMH 9824]|nr:hypothetical protein FS837_000112 [Tulasnella sp. UAMH 9824]
MSNPLDPSAILSVLPTLLPAELRVLQSQHDALAALIHTVMARLDFRLVGLDDSSTRLQNADNVLPEAWNRSAPESYTFRYTHSQSSLEYLVKVVKLGKRSVIHGIALETDKNEGMEITTEDYFSPSSFPCDAASPSQPLVNCFISPARVQDFVGLYKLKILQKLLPSLQKEGYQEQVESSNAPAAEARSSVGRDRPPPDRMGPPGRPYNSPDAGDYDPLRIPPRIPNIGRSDLDPIGRNPFAPPSLFGDDGDGMYVGPNHPIFRDRLGPASGGIGGGRGPWGGDGFLPPMGAPPGARFDPVGPGPLGPRGPFGPGGGLGPRRGGPGSREPDNDEFMPPGAGDMYS